MCRVVTRSLGATPAAAAAARDLTRERLARWDLDELAPDATLLVSELVTNAVLHARSEEVTLTLAVAGSVLEVGIADTAAQVPMPRSGRDAGDGAVAQPDAEGEDWRAEGGRGLRLLDRLADVWGVATMADGKQVWFRLSVPERWPFRTACPCGGEALEAVRLESGARALAVDGPWDA